MSGRETAWRVFAREFNSSKHEVKAEDEYSPSYVLSPLGAQMNRVFIVGVLTEVQNVGTETQPVWRAKITDPTGIFYVSAGKFQPKLAQKLSSLEPMTFVAIIGKTRTYSPEEGTVYVSIKPETIVVVDKEARDNWLIETAGSLKTRIDFYNEASQLDPATDEKLGSLGVPEYLKEGILRALDVYDDPLVYSKFKVILADVLVDFIQGQDMDLEPRVFDDAQVPQEDEEKLEAEKQVMILISRLSNEDPIVKVEEIKRQGSELEMDDEVIEDILADLLDNGRLFEPEIGFIQMV